jgi:hypothetical protein
LAYKGEEVQTVLQILGLARKRMEVMVTNGLSLHLMEKSLINKIILLLFKILTNR